MDDFKIKIGSQLDLENAKSQLQKFLSSHHKEKLKIDVELNNDLLKGLTKEFETAGKNASSAFNKGFTLSKSPSIKEFTNFQKSILDQTKATEKKMNNILGNSVEGKTQAKWADTYVKNQQKEIQKALREVEKIENIKQKVLNSSTNLNSLKILTTEGGSKKYGDDGYKKLTFQISAAENALEKFNTEIAKGDNANLDRLNSDMKEFISLVNKANREQDRLSENISFQKQTLALKDLDRYWNSNTKAHKDFEGVYEHYRSILSNEKLTIGQFEDASFGIKSMKKDIEIAGKSGKSFLDELSRGFRQIGQFAYTYGFVQEFPELIMRSVSELKEMDSILTEISKTSDLTSSQLKELGKDAFDNASKYGKTANEYLLGVQEMSRSGFYGKKAEGLAELSILGQAAGDMSADISNSYILATNAAYGYQGSVEKLGSVLDGQNVITNRNSVAMLDMAEATTQAGSMAAQSGVKIDQLSALIGTAVARTKKSGNEIGTALKALFVNLQDTQNKKITGTFDSLGISMTKMVGDSELLKTPIELLDELSKVYNSLPEGSVEKANILKNIGGKVYLVVQKCITRMNLIAGNA